jgi:hypothetical protein
MHKPHVPHKQSPTRVFAIHPRLPGVFQTLARLPSGPVAVTEDDDDDDDDNDDGTAV